MILLQYVIPIYTEGGGSLSSEGMKTLEGIFWFLNLIFIICVAYKTYTFFKGAKEYMYDNYWEHTFLNNVLNAIVAIIDAVVLLFVIGSFIGKYL